MEKWTHGMCIQWLRHEVKWSDKEIEVAVAWLREYVEPGRKLTLQNMTGKINLSELSENSLEDCLKKYNEPGTTPAFCRRQ